MAARKRERAAIWPGWRAQREPRRCRVLLIDDHAVVRDGLAALLALEPDLEIVGCADDIAAGIGLIRTARPDLVLCDLNLPGLSGGEAVQAIYREFPRVRLLVLTAHDSLEYVRAAFIAGAIGFVCKDASRSELLRAVRRSASGRRTVCGNVWESVVGDWLEDGIASRLPAAAGLDEAAARVLRLIALGVPTRQIARELGRGVKATEKFRTVLMRRLGLRSAAGVTRFAVEHRLVSSQELDHMLSQANA
ncbi:MAG: response regulator transcription factor [Gammaproteobacteria bacterium]|nr:response regulator transcription factor [Gammaproteobacteria bacterium]